jgi:hypothetical protein
MLRCQGCPLRDRARDQWRIVFTCIESTAAIAFTYTGHRRRLQYTGTVVSWRRGLLVLWQILSAFSLCWCIALSGASTRRLRGSRIAPSWWYSTIRGGASPGHHLRATELSVSAGSAGKKGRMLTGTPPQCGGIRETGSEIQSHQRRASVHARLQWLLFPMAEALSALAVARVEPVPRRRLMSADGPPGNAQGHLLLAASGMTRSDLLARRSASFDTSA